jgi:tellurite methyltransferase
MKNPYDERYDQEAFYWGLEPSPICFQVLQLLPPEMRLKLLEIGCSEGRNAIFFHPQWL